MRRFQALGRRNRAEADYWNLSSLLPISHPLVNPVVGETHTDIGPNCLSLLYYSFLLTERERERERKIEGHIRVSGVQ